MKKKDVKQYEDLVDIGNISLSLEEIELIAGDQEIKEHYEKKYGPNLYPAIFLMLTHERFNESDAKQLWQQTIDHLASLRRTLGRNPGISVAVLDYLSNIRGKLSEPVVIEEEKSDFITNATTKDGLTRLHLRSIFDVTLEKIFDESKRGLNRVCLAMIDIDDFKSINDTHGHLTGDKVLKKIGGIINHNVREMDLASRYGGEEFAIIMSKTDIQQAKQVTERIRKEIEKTNFNSFAVTVSIGLAQYSDKISNTDDLIKNADQALYEAKSKGKNQTIVRE